jgi:zinc finger protein
MCPFLTDMAEKQTEAPADEPKEILFQNIDGAQEVTEIESLCMNCHENGTTRLLLTKIPHFKEVVIMAFECPHCLYKNNEIQSAQRVSDMVL